MSFREELEQICEKPLNETEEKLVNKIKDQIKEYVANRGLRGEFKGNIELENGEANDIRSEVVVMYMRKEGLYSFNGGMTTNVVSVMYDYLSAINRPNTSLRIKFSYVVRF